MEQAQYDDSRRVCFLHFKAGEAEGIGIKNQMQ